METTTLKAKNVARSSFKTAQSVFNPRDLITSIFCLYAITWLNIFNFMKQFIEPFYRLLFAGRHPVVVRTPEDRFIAIGLDGLGYPFASNYVDVPFGAGKAIDRPRMHYIDECMGDKQQAQETILCLHGEPTWSFMYRKVVPILVQAGYRVVVPDMIGFGKSDKYVDMVNYNHEMHTFAVKHLINELGLGNNITLVCHDWGGLVGLSVVKDMPDRFSNLVITGTAVPTGLDDDLIRKRPITKIRSLLPFLTWRSLVSLVGTKLPVGLLFRRVVGLKADVAKAYSAPFPDSTYKAGVAKWPLMVPFFRDDAVAQHMVEVKSCLRVWQKPALVMFGDRDIITGGNEQVFMELIPHAKHATIHGANHFLMETHGEECAENIVKMLSKKM